MAGAQCVPAATTCHTMVIGPVRLLRLYASRRYGEAKFWHGSRHWLSERDRGGSGFVPVSLCAAACAALPLLYGRCLGGGLSCGVRIGRSCEKGVGRRLR